LCPKLVNKFIEIDSLPTFKNIKNNGISGHLISTIPPISAVSWSSIITGLNPGNHGVFDFITSKRNTKEMRIKINDSSSLRGMTLWNYLEQHRKKSIIVNVPLTYPPYPINGVMVSGFPSPINKIKVYPSILEDKLQNAYNHYKIDLDISKSDYSKISKNEFIKNANDLLDLRINLMFELMESQTWDFFFIVFTITDRLQHVFYPYSDSDYPKELIEKSKYKHVLRDLYVKLDKLLESVIYKKKEGSTIFIISDHGFESVYKRFGLIKWMQENDIIKRKVNRSRFQTLKKIYKLSSSFAIFDIKKIYSKLPRRIQNLIFDQPVNNVPGGIFFEDFNIDEKIMDKKELRDRLLCIVDQHSNRKIISDVIYKKELYFGKYAENSVDIIAIPEKGYTISNKQTEQVIEDITYPNGGHVSENSRKGVFYAFGKDIRHDQSDINCFDITPTILWYLTGDHRKSFDGSVRTELFKEKFMSNNNI
jgi:predicted AlkP superfamily phosphohydrolase/phosphomutase